VFRAAVKSVLAHKVRLALTALAIVLGVSMVVGTFVFTDTIDRQFDTLFDDIYSGIDVTVRKAGGDFSALEEPFDAAVLEDVKSVEGVSVAEGGVTTSLAQVIGKDGEPLGGQGPPTLGFSWSDEAAVNPLRIKEGNGRGPQGPGEVVIDANTAKNAEFAVGDRVRIVTNVGPEEFDLVGIVSFGESDSLLGATLVSFELQEARRLFGYADQFTDITVVGDGSADSETLRDRVAAAIPSDLEAITGEAQQSEQEDQITEALSFLNIGLLAFAGVAVFVGAFIIQNTFRIIISQRTRELALMRAIGATRRQVIWLVLIEALITAIVASLIGIAVGIGMAVGIRALMNAVGFGIPGESLVLAPRTVFVALTVGIVLTLSSAVLPARRASRVPPVAAMREELAHGTRRDLRRRALAGTALTALGAVLLLVGLFAGIDNAVAYVGAGAAVMFIGVSVLAPLAARPIADLIGAPLQRIYGVSGQLAKENTKRQPRRTASNASALMIGVALVAFFAVFGASAKATVEEAIFDLFAADVTVQSQNFSDTGGPGPISPAFADELAALPEVGVVSPLQIGSVQVDGVDTLIAGMDGETFPEVFSLKPVGDALERVGEENAVLVSETELEKRGWAVGDTVTIDYATTGGIESPIVGTFETNDFGNFYVSRQTYEENFSIASDNVVFANAAEGSTIEGAQVAVAGVAENYANLKVQTKSEIVAEAETQIDQALALFTVLLLFAVVIAVLGIVNTLTLSVYERTREIGLLRAIGMVRPQVRRMIRWEAVITSVFGAILGIVMGIFFGWAVIRALREQGFGAFTIPVFQIVLSLVLAALAGMVAAIWPARKAARLNVLEAISYE
jgi:putative ABC transport system permease protein